MVSVKLAQLILDKLRGYVSLFKKATILLRRIAKQYPAVFDECVMKEEIEDLAKEQDEILKLGGII